MEEQNLAGQVSKTKNKKARRDLPSLASKEEDESDSDVEDVDGAELTPVWHGANHRQHGIDDRVRHGANHRRCGANDRRWHRAN